LGLNQTSSKKRVCHVWYDLDDDDDDDDDDE